MAKTILITIYSLIRTRAAKANDWLILIKLNPYQSIQSINNYNVHVNDNKESISKDYKPILFVIDKEHSTREMTL